MPTVPVATEPKSGAVALGTIGFELYLAALRVPRATLCPPKVPADL